MEYFNRIVCVTYEDLTSGKDAIMKKEALVSLLRRHPHLRISRGCRSNNALIDYYSLPLRYRQLFEEKHGDPKELLEKEAVKATLVFDSEARAFFTGYRYDKGTETNTGLPIELVEEYTINASVLNILLERHSDCKALRRACGGTVRGVWEIVAETSEELRDRYGHTLPTNVARLRERINRYRKEGYPSLISGKVGNRSAAVIDGDAARCVIALKRSMTPVYTDAQLLDEYNRRARENGWKRLKSVKAITDFLNRPEVACLWWDARHGELAAAQKFAHRLKTELPQRRDSLWYGDGTRLNLYYREMAGGRNVVRTMQVYEVIDAYSEVFLGYHISTSENHEAQYHAYRMALDKSRHIPNELVCDNQGGHKKLESQEFFKKICHIYRPTKPYNGSSKTIESVFGRFQSQVLHKSWFFTGQNITAKKESSRTNIEFIQANVDKLPTLEEMKEIYAAYREEWNSMPHPATGVSRMEMYESSVNEKTHPVSDLDMIDIFWLYTKRPATYTGSGISITVGGETYDYEVCGKDGQPDRKFLRQHFGRRFKVQYDPADMKSVRLYTEDGRYMGTAEPKFTIHRAVQDQTEGERAYIAAELKANEEDRIERQAEARAIEHEHGTAPELHGLRRPKMAGMNRGRDATERDIERKMRKYARLPIPDNGKDVGKMISQAIYDPQTGEIDFDEYRMAAKL